MSASSVPGYSYSPGVTARSRAATRNVGVSAATSSTAAYRSSDAICIWTGLSSPSHSMPGTLSSGIRPAISHPAGNPARSAT